MSKKKAGGSTMTLKDFHGGSIPSDLPLPSAPGVIPKITTDRPWGASLGRHDQKMRPSSSHTIRNFDDKSLFLPYTTNIGRNFSEDERKPLDGHSAPRRMVSDDVFRVANSRLEVQADSILAGRHSGWSSGAGPFNVTRSVTMAGNSENSVSGTQPNVWAARKDASVANSEPVLSPWTSKAAGSSLAHTSALEQVSSGRWQTKLLVDSQFGCDVVQHSEIQNRGYKSNKPVRNQEDEPHTTLVEQGLITEDGIQGREAKNLSNSSSKPLPNYSEVRPAGHLVQTTAPSEVAERPKLNLLPRTKPLGSVVNDGKLANGASNLIQRDIVYATQKSVNISKPGLSADEIPNQPSERPKLNLKPVAQLLEQPEVKSEKERSAVFSDARPRELVLKDRGVDETENHKLENAVQRPTSAPRDLSTRKFEQKDGQSISDVARSEAQRRHWRENDNKSSRQQPRTREKMRHPSPETWRKPVPQKPDGTGVRRGKAASALELAQAFSPLTDAKSRIGNSNSFNNRAPHQQPFSRLVGSESGN